MNVSKFDEQVPLDSRFEVLIYEDANNEVRIAIDEGEIDPGEVSRLLKVAIAKLELLSYRIGNATRKSSGIRSSVVERFD